MARGILSQASIHLAFVGVIALALIGWGGTARAICINCSFDAGAGTGSSGTDETGVGIGALNAGPDAGSDNSAYGREALEDNTTGVDNTATGSLALPNNTTGNFNTATGDAALFRNTTGSDNTAAGFGALEDNTTGGDNTATGLEALLRNTTGSGNTATGIGALSGSTTGANNTAAGAGALSSNSTGNENIAVGQDAGDNLTTGSNNIDIGNAGVAGESNTIRIGKVGTQTGTFIAGIYSTTFSGFAPAVKEVVIDTTGHLGTRVLTLSSARYKRDIHDLGAASDKVLKLRPVSFRYKADPKGGLQYGLIAEEVKQVYPELVTYGDDGKIQAVRYELLPPLLLGELQKLAKENAALRKQVASQNGQIAVQQAQIEGLVQKDAKIEALVSRVSALEQQVRAPRDLHAVSAMR